MGYRFLSRSGIRVERIIRRIDYDAGIDFLVDRLDQEPGAYFSSGIEYPGRYSRWDFGFVSPPLEITARGAELTARALNTRGQRLLAILEPLLTAAEGISVAARTQRTLTVAAERGSGRFAEEERSRQPSVFTPLRRLIEDMQGVEDGFLGFYGAFGYDLIFQFDPMALNLPRDAAEPQLHLLLPDRIYAVDRRLETAMRVDFEFTRGDVTTRGLPRRRRPHKRPVPKAAIGLAGDVVSDHGDDVYAAKVEAARHHMVAGNVFEVVLSRRFSAPYGGPPSTLFRAMRQVNPSPYEFFIQLGAEQLVGASPEMFVRVEGDRVESCPIAGTIRRGANAMEDADRIRTLYASEKDEAELTMCTDVDRNDKARICRPGTVRLVDRRLIERYAGLFHTVDHVEGRLRPGFGGIDAFLSHMWAVTLTGAPKRKAVEIIETMESEPRRWYGGAIGMLGLNGAVNTGITIRTIHLHGGRADYRAGASIVYDSVGAEEERETRTKANAFFRIMAAAAGKSEPKATATTGAPGHGLTVLMIDNEDSFVHTLADYVRQTGAEVRTYRCGVPAADIARERPDLVIHSPGPGRPADFGVPGLVAALAEHGIAQFGVCLGLQGIAEAFGGRLALLPEPRHGKVWEVRHGGDTLFAGLPDPCRVGAYHSLHAPRSGLPEALEVTAWTAEGLVMALRHRSLPIAAVQFHPESILSMQEDLGRRLIGNAVAGLAAPAAAVPAAAAR